MKWMEIFFVEASTICFVEVRGYLLLEFYPMIVMMLIIGCLLKTLSDQIMIFTSRLKMI